MSDDKEKLNFLQALDHIFISRKCADLLSFLGVVVNGILFFWLALAALQSDMDSSVCGILALLCVLYAFTSIMLLLNRDKMLDSNKYLLTSVLTMIFVSRLSGAITLVLHFRRLRNLGVEKKEEVVINISEEEEARLKGLVASGIISEADHQKKLKSL